MTTTDWPDNKTLNSKLPKIVQSYNAEMGPVTRLWSEGTLTYCWNCVGCCTTREVPVFHDTYITRLWIWITWLIFGASTALLDKGSNLLQILVHQGLPAFPQKSALGLSHCRRMICYWSLVDKG
ncbi:uncharacterized protein MCYG_08576 [Microsporum canis CBS 113480]|uniref:Uncharacterized protein n=1 Tax=Arthroderma otae (strain ATCC MYA-4605 / CBS 113480) TaxID=554155 RepID=C5G0V4_ARTOC|nr:uncharacterized protein MCYG_08576 [Microsporum canis CBS 113480]EEQ35757.1 predicted protein [Microsporum canis CBS 113480]